MTNENETDDNLSGAYVLNSLSEAERRAFEQRMAASDDLRNEVTELADTAVLLGMATEPVQPSAALRASVLMAAAKLPQLPRDPAAAPAASEPVAPEADTAAEPAAPAVPASTAPAVGDAEARAAARWLRRPVTLITAFAAGLALLFGGMLLGGLLTGQSPEQQHAAAFAELNAAPDVQRMGTQLEGGGTATLVVSETLGRSAFIWNDLPDPGDDRVYELWYITDEPVPAGIFEPDAGQNFRVLDGELPEGASVGVTIEPEGGSEQPTTEPIVLMETSGA